MLLLLLAVLRGWTQGFTFVRQVLCHLSNFTSSFNVGYFWDIISLLDWVRLDHNLPICTSPGSWDDRSVPPCSKISWDRVSLIICPDWFKTRILLMFNYQVARVAVLIHSFQPGITYLKKTKAKTKQNFKKKNPSVISTFSVTLIYKFPPCHFLV
jgi:hypothetical protein